MSAPASIAIWMTSLALCSHLFGDKQLEQGLIKELVLIDNQSCISEALTQQPLCVSGRYSASA